ncbi:MAG: DUF2793 domain-containing protein [Octadecabacter sp.]
MSQNSPILALPYIQPAQAQKHVTHNEGMRILDAVAQLSVVSTDVSSPPAAPAMGDRYIVGPVALGAWVNQDGAVTVYDGSGWTFLPPADGWIAWVKDINALRIYNGTDWVAVPGFGDVGDIVGINTSGDTNNRLAVSSPASLFTHEGAGHQIKVNKAAEADTASLLFQTGFSGRAEMGTAGSDDFEIKVSPDGSTFFTALQIDSTDGGITFPQGAQASVMPGGDHYDLMTRTEVSTQTYTLVRNGFGDLGAEINAPDGLVWDDTVAPHVSASWVWTGYASTRALLPDIIPVDPNRVYRLGCSIRQEGLAGDWSAYPNEERHEQVMGLICLDRDGMEIVPKMHMRYRDGTTDSLTTLAAPLQPGDTQIQVTDASGWNDSTTSDARCGVIIFGYKDSSGRSYDSYSRYVESGLFDPVDVNKTTNIITLNQPLPASLGNPDDVNGAWPAGTAIANSNNSANKFSFFKDAVVPETDRWYRSIDFIGGIDRSGTDVDQNFTPGTAAIQIFIKPNQTNQSGGVGSAPDTGDSHRVWFAAIEMFPEPQARLELNTASGEEGSYLIYVPTEDPTTGNLSMAASTHHFTALDAPDV